MVFYQMASMDQSLRDTKKRLTEGISATFNWQMCWSEWRYSPKNHIFFFFLVSWKTSCVIGVRRARWEFWIDDHILRLECNIWSWSAFLTNWSIIRWNWLLPSPPFTLESLRTLFFFFLFPSLFFFLMKKKTKHEMQLLYRDWGYVSHSD